MEEHETERSDIGNHTAFRWLSLGKVLKRVWDLKAEIREFCEKKGKDIPELSDEDWMADFAFAVDVTALMNEMDTKLHGKGLFTGLPWATQCKNGVVFFFLSSPERNCNSCATLPV